MSVVLLVEDDKTYREWIRNILVARFPTMKVIEVAEGRQALKDIWIYRPDVVVMDFSLPGKNGLEITREIRAECPLQKIMFLTNYGEPEFRMAAGEMGVYHFLDKGTARANDIVRCLSSLLGDD